MYIGELAKRTGATPKAIRLYEDLGLLQQVARQGVYRTYTADHLQLVQLIRQGQSVGLRLSEMAPVLQSADGAPDWPRLLAQVGAKRRAVRDEVTRLRRLDQALAAIEQEVAACLAGTVPAADCGPPDPTAA